MLPLALAACTAYELVDIMRKQRQDLRGLEVRIESVQDPHPPWAFRSIRVPYLLRETVDSAKAARALKLSGERYARSRRPFGDGGDRA